VVSAAVPNGVTTWEKTALYHSTVFTPASFTITTIISSFRVTHHEQANNYDGWMAVADIGGFAFWMVILHTIAMIVVGFILPNESKFLGADVGAEGRSIM